VQHCFDVSRELADGLPTGFTRSTSSYSAFESPHRTRERVLEDARYQGMLLAHGRR